MHPVKTFHVSPLLPERLGVLEDLAYNLRWSWDHETISLFRRLDRDLWETARHNPVLMLGSISQERLLELAQDEAFLAHLDRVAADLRDYVGGTGVWHRKTFGAATTPDVAYFSMEFGITECLPIYSGGLGMLAGDHLKSASDLGVPLVGVGLLYQKGYFHQYLNAEGWQQESYPVNDFSTMPVRPCYDNHGRPVRVTVELAGTPVQIRPWRAQVGRVRLLLLDTNLPENPAQYRDITDELYRGGDDRRILQEIVLGIGGVRVLDAVGLRPRVFHMNEGHCAFLGLERIRSLMPEQGLSFAEALEMVAASGVFTTHTPVPAGIDVFTPEQMERYFAAYRTELGLSREAFLDLGRFHPGVTTEPFNQAVLAIRTSSSANGVSRLHGEVSRTMWQDLWAGVPLDEIPITHVTNGVHPQSWISSEMRELYDRYLGPRWAEEPGDSSVWSRGQQIPGEELWRTHERRRERLVGFARRRLADQLRQRGAGRAEVAQVEEVLDPEALTIGFARRFATYKRATLLWTRPRPARAHPQRRGAAGADHLRGQGAPARRRGQGLHPQGRPARPPPGVPPARGLPRGLRHGGGPLPGPGRGRVAQHAAAPARGLRDERHEGGVQRGAEPQHHGRLVGRGGLPAHRLVHRPGRGLPGPRVPGPPRGRGPLRTAGAGRGAALLRPHRGQPAAGLDLAHEERHGRTVPGLQHEPHGA